MVEERHIDCLKKKVISKKEDLQDFTRYLLGWTSTEAEQFLNNYDGQTIDAKFFNVAKKMDRRERNRCNCGKASRSV